MGTLLTVLAVCAAVSILAKILVRIAWAYYSNQFPSNKANTGSMAATEILGNSPACARNVVLQHGDSNCFDLKDDTIALTPEVYNGRSVLAICVAAHEAGHALQFSRRHIPLVNLKLFSNATSFMVMVSAIAVILYFYIRTDIWMLIAVLCVAIDLATRLVLLPIEFYASRIALFELSKIGCYNETELRKMKRMLRACAFTYVAAVLDVLLLIFLLVLAMLCSGKKNAPRKNNLAREKRPHDSRKRERAV
ncbi:MAG: zinc metallopeptidase [Clostridiales bacterium]|nr:zinc metallopeptidase [Clostridiales bacterium]